MGSRRHGKIIIIPSERALESGKCLIKSFFCPALDKENTGNVVSPPRNNRGASGGGGRTLNRGRKRIGKTSYVRFASGGQSLFIRNLFTDRFDKIIINSMAGMVLPYPLITATSWALVPHRAL